MKGIAFEELPVTEPANQKLLQEKYGRMATPTIVIDDRVFVGFKENRDEIEKLLKE